MVAHFPMKPSIYFRLYQLIIFNFLTGASLESPLEYEKICLKFGE
ncbi:hypothetical protein [Alkalihalobacillus sp. 1P02AB]